MGWGMLSTLDANDAERKKSHEKEAMFAMLRVKVQRKM